MNLKIKTNWCAPAACWLIDLLQEDGTALLQGVPMVTGGDLLEQFDYLQIGGQLVAQTDNAPDTPPTFENLGSLGHLYFFSP